MSITIYRLLLIIFYPFIRLYFLIRKLKGKESKESLNDRFCTEKITRLGKKLIWIHAVSVGEFNSAYSLIKKILENTDFDILVTTMSLASFNTYNEKISKINHNNRVMHRFLPVDVGFIVKRFLNQWKPDILINVESEIWPNLITYTSKLCPVIVLNGKMSKKSFRNWMLKINKKLKEQIFGSIDLCLAQTQLDEKRFILLGVKKVQYLGNIKFYVENLKIDNELYNKLSEQLETKKYRWLINSTHSGEEEIIIKSHLKLKERFPNLLTVIIIRHPNRSQEVQKLLQKNNIKYTLASENHKINEDTEVHLYDLMGNLPTLFRLFNIVFMGGSLVKNIGGHNPIEAAKESCAIITGPFIDNNKSLFKDLENDNGVLILKDNSIEEIYRVIEDLLNNQAKTTEIGNNAYYRTLKCGNLINEIVEIIKNKVA